MSDKTANYEFWLPEIDGDEDQWGAKLNANWNNLDALLAILGGEGDVTAAATLANNAVIRGDGGVKSVQESTVLISDVGVLSVPGVGLGGFSDFDVRVGNTSSYGMIGLGAATFGRSSRNTANLDLDGTVVLINKDTPPTSNILFAMMDGSNSMRFALPKSGVGNATYNPRSMILAGPVPNDDTAVTVGYWQSLGIFDNLACDTDTDGADLGVQNDLEVEGDLFTDSIKGSTDNTDIVIDPHGTGEIQLLGNFTSTGMEDNATGMRWSVNNTWASLGGDQALFTLSRSQAEDGEFRITAGASGATGITLYGPNHATLAADFKYQVASVLKLYFDYSANSWDFQDTDIITTGEIYPNGEGGPVWTSGSGTPEAQLAADVGSLYTRTDGGADTTLYVKESGTGSTGWVAK
jgi:hypothetical protein